MVLGAIHKAITTPFTKLNIFIHTTFNPCIKNTYPFLFSYCL